MALQRTLCEALVARRPQQAAVRIAAAAFELVVGPSQTRHVIAVEQTGPVTPADLVKVKSKPIESRCALGPQP